MINKINKLSEGEFAKVFANIFENAAWISKELYGQIPFVGFEDLSSKMLGIFDNASMEAQLKIIKSHPDLANKTKISLLTPDSKKEQIEAGLEECSEEEFNEFKTLNDKYKKKFGFPFIYAVKGKSKLEILSSFRQRVSCDINIEFEEAKKQVKKIASLRLNEIKKNEKNIF